MFAGRQGVTKGRPGVERLSCFFFRRDTIRGWAPPSAIDATIHNRLGFSMPRLAGSGRLRQGIRAGPLIGGRCQLRPHYAVRVVPAGGPMKPRPLSNTDKSEGSRSSNGGKGAVRAGRTARRRVRSAVPPAGYTLHRSTGDCEQPQMLLRKAMGPATCGRRPCSCTRMRRSAQGTYLKRAKAGHVWSDGIFLEGGPRFHADRPAGRRRRSTDVNSDGGACWRRRGRTNN